MYIVCAILIEYNIAFAHFVCILWEISFVSEIKLTFGNDHKGVSNCYYFFFFIFYANVVFSFIQRSVFQTNKHLYAKRMKNDNNNNNVQYYYMSTINRRKVLM